MTVAVVLRHVSLHRSAERERKRLHARVKKLDLELAVDDGAGWRISWYIRCSVTVPMPCSSTSTPCAAPGACPSSSTRNRTEAPRAGRTHDEVEVAGVKAVRDPTAGLVQDALPCFPLVQSPESAH